jgi:hypothetical protein
MRDWYEGQKVICIDNNWLSKENPNNCPKIGCIYTIDKITIWPDAVDGMVSWTLVEITNKKWDYYECHFRPVEEKGLEQLRYAIKNIPKTLVEEFKRENMVKGKKERKFANVRD